MGERLLEYNIKASRMNSYLPVLSCVISLKKEKDAPRSPFIQKLLNGTPTTFFYYASIDLGELTVGEFLEKVKGKASLLPLLPLTAGGNRPEAIDIMIEELIAADKTDLLWIGYVLAAKLFDNDDLQWLKRRFALMNDFLWDSPVYQEIISGVQETAKLEALSSTRQNLGQELLSLIDARFPDLKELASKCVDQIDDTDVLIHLLGKVGSAKTEQEAKKVLATSLNS